MVELPDTIYFSFLLAKFLLFLYSYKFPIVVKFPVVKVPVDVGGFDI